MKLLLHAPINPHSGYGNDGIGLALAFRQAGCDVYLDPMHVQAPLPTDVAELFTKRLEGPWDLHLHHTDPGQLGITDGARRNSAITVAHTMWEFSTLDNLAGRSKLRRNLKNYDLVVGYDAVSTQALGRYVTTNAATVQGGYWPRSWPARPRDWNSPTLRFCMVGALGPRKDPFLAIDAFRELREEHPDVDIELSIKTVTPGLHSKLEESIAGLRIYYEVWPEEVLRDFYYSHHVLLAPSRGEGKNVPALEMMSTGGTVIATNWGGHTQWLSPAIAYPLEYTLQPVSAKTPDCLWAKASKDHLKQLMLAAYRDRADLSRRAETAADLIPAMCSWPKAVDRLMERVGEVAGDRGERVLHKYRVAKARADESRQVSML
jgi:glycosyltransferase involved in cell wall biosynthesis